MQPDEGPIRERVLLLLLKARPESSKEDKECNTTSGVLRVYSFGMMPIFYAK